MGRRPASAAGSGDSAEFTGALLARLGLPPDAGPHDIEAAHDRLVAFLESAPSELRSWARQQAAAADAAFALLSGPGGTPHGTAVRDGHDDEPDEGAAEPPDDEFDEDAQLDGDDQPAAAERPSSGRAVRTASQGRVRRFRVIPIAVALAVAAVIYGVYQSGDHGVPPLSAGATAAPTAQPLDEAKVTELMKKLDADPRDADTLRALGDLYFQAADYRTAATWEQKIIDIDPKDVTARLALGAALFNTGDTQGAEKQWLAVVELDPKQAEAHYDLGFLYLSADPPDMAKAKAAWARVIEIDPDSDLARTVAAHLRQLESPSPSPSASGG